MQWGLGREGRGSRRGEGDELIKKEKWKKNKKEVERDKAKGPSTKASFLSFHDQYKTQGPRAA